MKLAIIEYKRRKYYRSASALFKRVLNGYVADYIGRVQGKTIDTLRIEADKPIDAAPIRDAVVRLYVAVGSDFARAQLKELRTRKALTQDNVEADYWEEYFRSYARTHAAAKIKTITGTTEKIFKETVNRIIEANPDKGIYDIMKLIRDELTTVSKYRAERIARTEVNGASNRASYEAARNAGIPVQKVWSAIMDEATRDEHSALNGEVRRVDEPFSNGQMTPEDGAADQVINCRCGIDYITEDDDRFVQPERHETPIIPLNRT